MADPRTKGCAKQKDIIGKLGQGTYGVVYKVKEKGKFYALKTYDPQKALIGGNLIELDILVRVNHPNVLNAHSVKMKDCGICLMLPLADGDLDKWLERNPLGNSPKEVERRMTVFYKTMCGLQYLHSNHIIHQDIKPPNILMTGDEPKLADFGLSSVFPHDRIKFTFSVGTSDWKAPEILAEETTYTSAIDVWSMGVVLYQLLTGDELIGGDTESPSSRTASFPVNVAVLSEIARKVGRLSPSQAQYIPFHVIIGVDVAKTMAKVPQQYKQLLLSMLQPTPSNRATAADIVAGHGCVVSKIEPSPFTIAPSAGYLKVRQELMEQTLSIIERANYGIEVFFLAADILDRYATIRQSDKYISHMLMSVYLAAEIYNLDSEPIAGEIVGMFRSSHFAFSLTNFGGNTPVERFMATLCDAVTALDFRIFRPTIDLHFPTVDKAELAKCVIANISPDDVAECTGSKGGRKTRSRAVATESKRRR